MKEIQTRGVGYPDFTRPIVTTGIPLPTIITGNFILTAKLPFVGDRTEYSWAFSYSDEIVLFAKNIRINWENFIAKITIESESGNLTMYGKGSVEFKGNIYFKPNVFYKIILEKEIPVESTLVTIYMDGVYVNKTYVRWLH